MSVLRNLVVIFSFLIFAATTCASADNSTETQHQNKTHKVAITKKTNEIVNINSADAITLQKVKGIGKKKAQVIVEYRSANGPFASVNDLLKIKSSGINKKWLDKVSKFLTV